MTDTVNGHLTKRCINLSTPAAILTLPEKLPLGKYRIVVTGPNGFYNEWLDSAGKI